MYIAGGVTVLDIVLSEYYRNGLLGVKCEKLQFNKYDSIPKATATCTKL
jgi:hypothetical protein